MKSALSAALLAIATASVTLGVPDASAQASRPRSAPAARARARAPAPGGGAGVLVSAALGGVGVLGLATGVASGAKSRRLVDEWAARCDAGACDDPGSKALRREAFGAATVSLVALAVSSAAFVGAALASLSGPGGGTSSASAPQSYPVPGGVGARW